MSDLLLAWDDEIYAGDLVIDDDVADLATEDPGLRTAVLVSLFTDRRVAEGLPPGEAHRRGWWGDTLTGAGEIGSRLWLLGRAKRTPETMRRAEGYAREALEWLVTDGVVLEVDVRAESPADHRLLLRVVLTTQDGAETLTAGVA